MFEEILKKQNLIRKAREIFEEIRAFYDGEIKKLIEESKFEATEVHGISNGILVNFFGYVMSRDVTLNFAQENLSEEGFPKYLDTILTRCKKATFNNVIYVDDIEKDLNEEKEKGAM